MRKYIFILAALLSVFSSCTNLDEKLYDQLSSGNYYDSKMAVNRAVFRPFEHAYWSVMSRQQLEEMTADLVATWSKDTWWEDGGKWSRPHYHTLNPIDDELVKTLWEGCFQGIMLCNSVLTDLDTLDPSTLGYTAEGFAAMKAQLTTLRAWFYLRLLGDFRNVPLIISSDRTKMDLNQVEPATLFSFIESELKESVEALPTKEGAAGNGTSQGQWTKAGAAALLVRLYMGAQKWVGTPKFNEAAAVAEKILNGEYGTYAIASRWDAPFDWNNETCEEVIYAFPSDKAHTHHLYSGDMYWWTVPARTISDYLDDYKTEGKFGDHNCKYGLAPSFAPNGTAYTTELGRPVAKFKKYPTDYRLGLYKNLGESRREGMMLFGYLDCVSVGTGKPMRVKHPEKDIDLYLRDAVGKFGDDPKDDSKLGTTSNMTSGDHHSGWRFIKYPLYKDSDEGQCEADYVEIRLAEVVYSLAECKLRAGDAAGAASLLNSVRRRNYPAEDFVNYAYAPEGPVELDMAEMLDEWGREFLAEGRRRTDLIRFDKFWQGSWWDKTPDTDNHTEIYPIHRDVLNSNPLLKQNPGYSSVE